MFNIQPGTGLGFEANKQIALGLGTGFLEAIKSACGFLKELIQKSFLRGQSAKGILYYER